MASVEKKEKKKEKDVSSPKLSKKDKVHKIASSKSNVKKKPRLESPGKESSSSSSSSSSSPKISSSASPKADNFVKPAPMTPTSKTLGGGKKLRIKETIAAQKDVAPPFAVHFPGVTPTEIESINCYTNTKQQKNATVPEKVLALETRKLIYSAPSSGTNDLVKYAVGVVDKRDGSIKVIELPHIYTMQHELKAKPKLTSKTSDVKNQRHALVEAFGSRRRLQGLRQSQANSVTKDNVSSGEAINRALKQKALTERAEVMLRDDLPPYNEHATKKEDAYPVENLIANEDWAHFKNDCKEFLACFNKGGGEDKFKAIAKDPNYPSVVVGRLREMIDGNEKDKKIINLLLFATYLMRFYHRLKSDRSKIYDDKVQQESEYTLIPEHFFKKFSAMFTETKIRNAETITHHSVKPLDIKLLNYIFIALLHTNDFVIDVTQTCNDLGIEKDTAIKHLKAIGCTIDYVKRGEKASAKLKVPLQFPKLEKRNAKKK